MQNNENTITRNDIEVLQYIRQQPQTFEIEGLGTNNFFTA